MKNLLNILKIIEKFMLNFKRIVNVENIINPLAKYSRMTGGYYPVIPFLYIEHVPCVVIIFASGKGR